MYNATTRYIKSLLFSKLNIPNLSAIKKALTHEKNRIKKMSTMKVWIPISNKPHKQKTITIDKHVLDYAINDALNRYKSCVTNFKQGNIKHFRLRYLKLTKPNKILKIEKLAFREKTFWSSVMGDVVHCSSSDFNYIDNIHTVAILTKRK